MEQMILESMKVGGPVALLIVLGYLERKSMLDRHAQQLERFIKVTQDNVDAMNRLVSLVKDEI